MRKEVKLGFAIGGVLLSVLVVYVLVISGSPRPQEVTMVTSEPGTTQSPQQPAGDDQNKPRSTETVQSPEQNVAATATPTAAEPKVDPFKSTDAPAATETPTASSNPPANDASNKSSGEDKWAGYPSALPVMLTTTPMPESSGASSAAPVSTADNKPAPSLTTPIAVPSLRGMASGSPAAAASPSTRPANAMSTAPRTHVVQSGETFALIAEAAYGSAAYYPHLLRANPNVDPKKLHPGMVVNIPPVSEVRADQAAPVSASANANSQSPSLDSKNEYRVQAGDSLYKISTKLYGKADRVDKIYEANKSVIGADRTKLKVGMVLKLPEAPTQKVQ